jgi:hypothetical protein
MTSTFGAAFDKLPHELQRRIIKSLNIRRNKHVLVMGMEYFCQGIEVVLLGDTPGPGRPTDPNYHHTPFYSTKHCSLWVNKLLVEEGIDERRLLWFNTTLADGTPLEQGKVTPYINAGAKLICLGGKAEAWVRRIHPLPEYVKVNHPQFAKRFKSKEPYALITEIKKVCNG